MRCARCSRRRRARRRPSRTCGCRSTSPRSWPRSTSPASSSCSSSRRAASTSTASSPSSRPTSGAPPSTSTRSSPGSCPRRRPRRLGRARRPDRPRQRARARSRAAAPEPADLADRRRRCADLAVRRAGARARAPSPDRPEPGAAPPPRPRAGSGARARAAGARGLRPAPAQPARDRAPPAALRLRHRLIVTVLVVACCAALVGVAAQVLGGTAPASRRHRVGRRSGEHHRHAAGTVGDLLRREGIVLRDGDRVVPSTTTALEQGMPIHVFRAFPMTADVDGTVIAHRTTHHDRREHPSRAERADDARARRRPRSRSRAARTMVFRTPHDVALSVDDTTHAAPHQTRAHRRRAARGAQGRARPARPGRPAARRPPRRRHERARVPARPDTVVEDRIIPFPTEYRDDPTLAAGHTATVQAGRNGLMHRYSNVVTQGRPDRPVGRGRAARRSSSRRSPRSCAGARRSRAPSRPPPAPAAGERRRPPDRLGELVRQPRRLRAPAPT